MAHGVKSRKLIFYTLYNYVDTPDDFYERVKALLEWGVVVYPMKFEPLSTLQKGQYISPHWKAEDLDLVQRARRVIGYAGAFPPYEGLVKKFRRANDFYQAFALRPTTTSKMELPVKALNEMALEHEIVVQKRNFFPRLEKRKRLAENLAWQIGSDRPPTVCLCCGSRFDEDEHKLRGPYLSGLYIWVCKWCWTKPYLFFPDKENDFPKQSFDTLRQEQVEMTVTSDILNQKFPMKLATGKELECELRTTPLSSIHLDPHNVRLKHIQTTLSEQEIEDEIWKSPRYEIIIPSYRIS